MPTIVATPNSPSANSFATEAEVDAYFAARVPLPTPWVASAPGNVAAILQAGRFLNSLATPKRMLMRDGKGYASGYAYYIVSRYWLGTIATDTQSMAFGRTGLVDAYGRAIDGATVPQALKEAQAELAGLLLIDDSTLQDDVVNKGIKRIRAGSVELEFNDGLAAQFLPDSVLNLIPSAWLSAESVEPVVAASVDNIGRPQRGGCTW